MVPGARSLSEPFGVPRKAIAWSTGAAAALGVVYAWSPMLVWFTIAMSVLVKYAGKGLSVRERRWVWGLLLVALGLRVLVVAALFLHTDHYTQPFGSMFGDGRYAIDRSMWMRNLWLGKPIGPLYLLYVWDGYGWTGYHFLLAYLQVFVGPIPYGVHLLNIGFFLAAAVMLHRLSRSAFGRAPAVAAFGAILFLPTLFVWSISELKEAFLLFLVTASLTAIVAVWRTRGFVRRVAALTVLVAALGALEPVRQGALPTFALGAACGMAVAIAATHWRRLPYAFVALVVAGVLVARTPTLAGGLSSGVAHQIKRLATTHIGNVLTTGHAYKLLDQKFYYHYDLNCLYRLCELGAAESARFMIRGAAAFVFVPAPWQMMSASELGVLPQQGAWYLLFLLALVGLPVALRRDPLVAGLLGGYAAVGAAVISLASGNVGTLIRHRDTVVPFVLCLSAVGGCALVRWCLTRTPPAAGDL